MTISNTNKTNLSEAPLRFTTQMEDIDARRTDNSTTFYGRFIQWIAGGHCRDQTYYKLRSFVENAIRELADTPKGKSLQYTTVVLKPSWELKTVKYQVWAGKGMTKTKRREEKKEAPNIFL